MAILGNLLAWVDPNGGWTTISTSVDVNNDGRNDEFKVHYPEKGPPSAAQLIFDRGRGHTTEYRGHDYFEKKGVFLFEIDPRDAGLPFDRDDLVQVPFSATSNSPVQTRALSFFVEFNPATHQMRKLVGVNKSAQKGTVDFFQADAVTLISKAPELDSKADRVVAKTIKTRAEVVVAEKKLAEEVRKEVQRAVKDDYGQALLLNRVSEKIKAASKAEKADDRHRQGRVNR